MTAGTVLPAVRAKLIDLISGLPAFALIPVGYEQPKNHADLSGYGEAVWLGGETEATVEASALRGGLNQPVPVMETWAQTVLIQALPRSSIDTQREQELRVGDLLGAVYQAVLTDPHLGLAVDGWGSVQVMPSSWRWIAGALPSRPGAAVRAELQLTVEADQC